jgi:hypothetical protein
LKPQRPDKQRNLSKVAELTGGKARPRNQVARPLGSCLHSLFLTMELKVLNWPGGIRKMETPRAVTASMPKGKGLQHRLFYKFLLL